MRFSRGVCALVATGALALVWPATAAAQQKGLTVEAIYDPDLRADFNGAPPTDLKWIDRDHYQWVKRVRAGHERDWLRVDAATGNAEPLFDAARMEAALAALPGVTRTDAQQLARGTGLILNDARTGAAVTVNDQLYFYDFTTGHTVPLTNTPGEAREVTFSPDGRHVAFVRTNNLYTVDIDTRHERALTSDGGPQVLNGRLDWLYQEEIYGRGNFRAYWWSPDSGHIAFLRLDEHSVPGFTVVDHIPYRPLLEVSAYPNAGDPNPTARLGIAAVTGGEPQWVDLKAYTSGEFLIVDVAWTPDGVRLSYQVQNREQTWLDLNLADANGATHTLLRETTKAWVNANGNPLWLKDGTFLWQSERSGFKHLYLYRADGRQLRQVTSGRWEVRALYGVDEASDWVYFAGTERTAIGQDVYRIKLNGSGMTRLSRQPGRNRAEFDPTFTRYIGFWSDISTPTQVRLHKGDGAIERVIDANPVPALAEYGLASPEFVQVKTRDGFAMEAMMIKPRNFDPTRRYPVFQHTYAGPTAQSVLNAWQGPDYLFLQMLAQHDVIVWICDNRSASGKGAEAQWPVYGHLGELELQDIEDGVLWLKQQSYVDASRILLSGWSYGGFMTAYAMTHSTSFAAGIIGAPVTDWHDYDSVYTERYMKMPQDNAEGYRRTSAVAAASHLSGKALIIHGTTDDNVHLQNSLQFAYELQKAGKSFEMMLYPESRHGITDPRLNAHAHQLMFDFVMRTIGASNPRTGGFSARQ
jgi:dipeptidyl-peptidase-4